MNRFFRNLPGNLHYAFLGVAAILICLSLLWKVRDSDIVKISGSVERRLERLGAGMDRYAERLLDMPAGQWADIGRVPDYVVIYKYVNDTLHSWINHFPLRNDEIIDGGHFGVRYNRLSRVQTLFMPLLSGVNEKPAYMNIGPQWFMTRSYERDNVKLVCGILIKEEGQHLDSPFGGVNPKLKLPENMTVYPVSYSDGATVEYGGVPVFNVAFKPGTMPEAGKTHFAFKWGALFFVLGAFFSYYAQRRTPGAFVAFVAAMVASMPFTYLWAARLKNSLGLFSPVVYADSSLHASLGTFLLTNLYVFMFLLAIFILRKRMMLWYSKHGRKARLLYASCVILLAIGLFVYIHVSLRSLVFNSNIVLEIFRLDELSVYSFLVYGSYIVLFMGLVFLIQLLLPLAAGKKHTVFSGRFLSRYSICVSLYMTIAVSIMSNAKEINMARAWTNRLSVERDLATELLLRMVEDRIEQDRLIHAYTAVPNGSMIIAEQLGENYFSSLSTGYDIRVTVCGEGDRLILDDTFAETDCFSYFRDLLSRGVPLHDNSHFFYINDQSGKIRYLGLFMYRVPGVGLRRMYIEIDSRMMKEQRGYSDIFPEARGHNFNIPSNYSYAKYISQALVFYRGDYNFPVSFDKEFTEKYPDGFSYRKEGDDVVFVNKFSSGDIIMITREKRGWLSYFIAFSYLCIFTVPVLMLLLLWKPKKTNIPLRFNSFRTKIMVLLLGTICGTVLLLTLSMILFYVGRNARERSEQMREKLHTVQSMFLDVSRTASSIDALMSGEVRNAMDRIAAYTHTDINLYDVHGHLMRSTRSELYFLSLAGTKIDSDAFYSIVHEHRKSFFNKEKIAGRSFYSLYAPVINEKGRLIGIINIPYFEQTESFRRDLVSTIATIVNIFVIMIAVVVVIGAALTASLFSPLFKLYERLQKTDLFSTPEKIDYDTNDEVSYIVKAYNRMIDKMSDSTRRFAISEREEAWREMAKQIAHEIKNSLTPMKLNIQYLQHMRQKGGQDWDERFGKICSTLLEQIEVLSKTATNFSSFAKLNDAEQPADVDLDEILGGQKVLFDRYEDVLDIDYRKAGEMVGETYHIFAPKSEIIRVFVNLFTNAVQAVEPVVRKTGQRGRICVTLTKFTAQSDSQWGEPGVRYVRVDVEDNGPGVSAENRSKLFTPNFTNKTGGSGLGLAICRNLVERVGGTIVYMASEEFGGADFRVIIPEYIPTSA